MGGRVGGWSWSLVELVPDVYCFCRCLLSGAWEPDSRTLGGCVGKRQPLASLLLYTHMVMLCLITP